MRSAGLKSNASVDYLIIGGGILGLTVARELRDRDPDSRIHVIEKEPEIAWHASGRNSGVLHAGFYYTADSLKARFTKEGNRRMRRFCEDNRLRLNPCGKVVVAANELEVGGLEELKRRGDRNDIDLTWLDPAELAKIDSCVQTHECALYSPTTATLDPFQVCQCLARELETKDVCISTGVRFSGQNHSIVHTSAGPMEAGYVVNCAGLYADQVARAFDFCHDKVVIPFKGLYLKYSGSKMKLRTNVYPVPNLENPFLGVHFTVTVDGAIKIGPTAMPALWRENYSGLSRLRLNELLEIVRYSCRLLLDDAFGFRRLALEEARKYNRSHLLDLAAGMVRELDFGGFQEWSRPGIRAQLLNVKTLELVQDFEIEGDARSLHVLNAVSPAFTCAFPFAEFIVDKIRAYTSQRSSKDAYV